MAVTWDGKGHRLPIFGEVALRRVLNADSRREDVLAQKNWRHISVVDEGKHNPVFVAKMVDEIIALLGKTWTGKKELYET